jgi:hypothetical protein
MGPVFKAASAPAGHAWFCFCRSRPLAQRRTSAGNATRSKSICVPRVRTVDGDIADYHSRFWTSVGGFTSRKAPRPLLSAQPDPRTYWRLTRGAVKSHARRLAALTSKPGTCTCRTRPYSVMAIKLEACPPSAHRTSCAIFAIGRWA